MIIYNVTTKIATAIQQDWLKWLTCEHIPDLINTGCFTHAVILQLIEADNEEGSTYAVQYHAADIKDYDRYIDQYATVMRNKALDKWGDQFISFRTLMKVVH